jgi:hypothetical protein
VFHQQAFGGVQLRVVIRLALKMGLSPSDRQWVPKLERSTASSASQRVASSPTLTVALVVKRLFIRNSKLPMAKSTPMAALSTFVCNLIFTFLMVRLN